MNKNMKLADLIELCKKYIDGDIDLEFFKQECDKVFVKHSISLRQKIYGILYVLFECMYDDDLMERFVSLEMNKFWYILLMYCDIDATQESEYCTEENYELIREATMYDAILSIARYDYEDTLRIFNEIINYVNSMSNQEIFQNLANTDFSKLIEADKALFEDIRKNEELIKDLADITRMNNPELQSVKKNMEKTVIEKINNKNR